MNAVTGRAALVIAVVVGGGPGCGLIGYGDDGSSPAPACFPSVAIGKDHACVVNRSGAIWCWGQDNDGQASGTAHVDHDGPIQPAPVQVSLPTAARPSEIAAGTGATCAITDDGGLWCWGAGYGAPVQVLAGENVYRVGLGRRFACAKVGGDDHVACWGESDDLRLGGATTTGDVDYQHPVIVPGDGGPLTGLVDLTVGHRTACARLGTGDAWCWGYDGNGQLGAGAAAAARPATVIPALAGVERIALGGRASCALDEGLVRCWGANALGQLGRGTPGADQLVPRAVSLAAGVQQLAVMAKAACVLDDAGGVSCWGQNRSGELGQDDLAIRPAPTALPALTGATSLAAGYHQACVEHGGGLWCWGDNLESQLGRSPRAEVTAPRRLGGPGVVFTSVRGGGGTLCAIDDQQRLWCWGDGELGQLGVGGQAGAVAPTMVRAGVREVAVGGAHTCARSDRTLWCWGALTTPLALIPQVVVDGAAISTVAAGDGHRCAIVDNGLRCWGANDRGQVGDGTMATRSAPVPIAEVANPKHLALGGAHSCALDGAGALYCWGAGGAGQLGRGDRADASRPVVVAPGQVFREVAAGRAHTCAIDGADVLRCWGANDSGQLGYATPPPAPALSTTPQPVAAVGPVAAVFIRRDTTCVVTLDGVAQCWGDGALAGIGGGGITPRPFGAVTGINGFGGGAANLCAVTATGELWCAGAADRGQFGPDPLGWTPAPVAGLPCE